MAMLAERKQRNRYTLVPRGKALYEDENRFGTKMLEKMGWKKGQGIGVNNDGSKDFVRVRYKNDNLGFGFVNRDDQWTQHEQIFNGLLKVLNKGDDVGDFNMQKDNNCEDDIQPRFGFGFQGPAAIGKPNQEKIKEELSGISLEERSKQSKVRVHYKKFTKGKDLTQYSEKDLANIFGKKSANDLFQHLNNSLTNDEQNSKGLQIINTGVTVNEYFKAKMEALKNQNRCNGINVGENFSYKAQIEEYNTNEAEYAEKTKEEEEENEIKQRKLLENNEQLDFLKKEKVTKKKRKNVEDINLDKTSLGEPMEKSLKQNAQKTDLDYCVEKVNENESKYVKQTQKFKELDESKTVEITEEPLKEEQKETNTSNSSRKKRSKRSEESTQASEKKENLYNFNKPEEICDHSLEKLAIIEGNELSFKSLRKKKAKRNKDSIETSLFEDHLYNSNKPDETCSHSSEKLTIIEENYVNPKSLRKKKSRRNKDGIETPVSEDRLSNINIPEDICDHSLEKFTKIDGNELSSKSLRKKKSKRNKNSIETSVFENNLSNLNKPDETCNHSLKKLEIIEGNNVCQKSPKKKKSKKSIEPSAIEENLSNLSIPDQIEGNDVNPNTFRKENSEKLNDSIETSGSEDNLSSLKKPEEKVPKAKRKNLSPNVKRPLISDVNFKELSLEEMKEKCKAFNIYPISSFCAEKFRNLNVNDFNGSSLAEIEGYGLGPDLQLDVKFMENDEERIISLWEGVLNKYVQSGKPKRAYRQYIKKTIEARKENQKRPKLSIKTWKRKNAFQII